MQLTGKPVLVHPTDLFLAFLSENGSQIFAPNRSAACGMKKCLCFFQVTVFGFALIKKSLIGCLSFRRVLFMQSLWVLPFLSGRLYGQMEMCPCLIGVLSCAT